VLLLEKPAMDTCSYHLKLVMLRLFCNTVFPQIGRAIVISLRVLCTEIQHYQLLWLLLRSLFVTLHEETSLVAVHLHVTVWRTLHSDYKLNYRLNMGGMCYGGLIGSTLNTESQLRPGSDFIMLYSWTRY